MIFVSVIFEEAEVEWFYEDLQDLLELTPPKKVLFIIGDWNAKVGSQETPGVTGKSGLGIQNEAGQRLIEFSQENTLVIANTLFQQHERRLYTCTSPDGQHQNHIDYTLCSQRWRSSMLLSRFSRVWLFATLWTVACQAPLSMEFSRQEYWLGSHALLQGIFLMQGSNLGLPNYRQILYHLRQ